MPVWIEESGSLSFLNMDLARMRFAMYKRKHVEEGWFAGFDIAG